MTNTVGDFTPEQWTSKVMQIMKFYKDTDTLKYQDMEDIASIAMMNHTLRLEKYGRSSRKDWVIVDAIRTHCGRDGRYINRHKSFTDLSPELSNLNEDYDPDTVIDEFAYDDFESKIELEEIIDGMSRKNGGARTGAVLKHIAFDNSTLVDAGRIEDAPSDHSTWREMRLFKQKMKEETNEDYLLRH